MAPRARLLASLALLAPSLLACTDAADDGPPQVSTGSHSAFVQRGWRMPATSMAARDVGFDLDHDGSRDNLVGSLIGGLADLGLAIEDANLELIGSGDPILAHVVRADRLDDDGSVAWQQWRSTGAPLRFDGSDRIEAGTLDGELWGAIRGGALAARWGATVVRVPLFPGQPPLAMPLTEAQVELTVDGPCQGRIGGTVLETDLVVALDELGRQTIAHLQAHPEHEFSTAAVDIMDRDSDGALTATEVAAFGHQLLAPDVDLDDDNGADGVSFALTFDCAPAQLGFVPPLP